LQVVFGKKQALRSVGEGDAMKLQTVRERARAREPLHGVDAWALEGALAATERDRDEALAKYKFILDHNANKRLDDARELASQLLAMKTDRDEAQRSAFDFERALNGSRAMFRRLEGRIRDLLRIDVGSGDE